MRFLRHATYGILPVIKEPNEGFTGDLRLVYHPGGWAPAPGRGDARYGFDDDDATFIGRRFDALGFGVVGRLYWFDATSCTEVTEEEIQSENLRSGFNRSNVTRYDQIPPIPLAELETVMNSEYIGRRWRTPVGEDPRLVVWHDEDDDLLIVIPPGSDTAGMEGWPISGVGAERLDAVRHVVTSHGLDPDAVQFRWVETGEVSAVVPANPLRIHVYTVPPSVSGRADDIKGMLIYPEHGPRLDYGYLALPPGENGSRMKDHADQNLHRPLREMGLDSTSMKYLSTNLGSGTVHEELTGREAARFIATLRQPVASSGWDLWSVLVLENGSPAWRPAVYASASEVHVLYRADDVPEETEYRVMQARSTDNYGTFGRRMGMTGEIRYSIIPGNEVMRFVRGIDYSLLPGRIFAPDNPIGALVEAVDYRKRRIGRISAGLVKGGRRLDMADYVPRFMEEVGLPPLKEYVVTAQVQIPGTVQVRQTVLAPSLDMASEAFSENSTDTEMVGGYSMNLSRVDVVSPSNT